MDYVIKLLPIVKTDLQKTKKWYNKKKNGLGEEFKLEVNREIDYKKNHPEYYQLKYKELRQSLINRFPYAIFYLVEPAKKRVIVFDVLHTKRNPEIARERFKK